MPKEISIGASTLLGFKSEVLKKKAEAKSLSKSNSSLLYVPRKEGKKNIFHDKEAEAKKKADKDKRRSTIARLESEILEEEIQLKRSKERLAKKAQLYDHLQNAGGIPLELAPENEFEPAFMVDFERKAEDSCNSGQQDEPIEMEHVSRSPSPSDHRHASSGSRKRVNSDHSDNEDDWVDYVDSFGRTRRCLKEDLSKFEAQDVKIREENAPTSSSTHHDTHENERSSEIRDMRERTREPSAAPSRISEIMELGQFDEAEAEKKIGPVHYQHVHDDEAREFGVSYYKFSTDENTRKKQMAELNVMRDQTVSQRARSAVLKEKRKKMLNDRLAKVAERKKIKFDEPISEEEEETAELDEIPLPSHGMHKDFLSASVISDYLSEKKRQLHVRPWDEGKKTSLMSDEVYLDKQRSKRQDQFAPPSRY